MGNTLTAAERANRKQLNDQLMFEGKHQCSKCLEIKTLDEFTPYGKKSPGKPYSQCRECTSHRINKRNNEKAIERRKTYKTKCDLCDTVIQANRKNQAFCCKKHMVFAWQIKQYQGTIEDARRLFKINNCAICGSSDNLCIDHHHKTNKLRSRLCKNCNSAIGYFFESTQIMKDTISYLENDLVLPEIKIIEDRTKCRWCDKKLLNPHFNRKFCSMSCKHRAGDVKEKFGISIEQYKWLLEKQNNQCPCCHKSLYKPLIEHNHTTGAIRGITCLHCNFALGHIKDNINNINNAILYLDLYRDKWDDWHVELIENKLARLVAVDKHYLHRAPNVSFGYGLYYKDELKGICTFGSPSSKRITESVCPDDPKSVLELNRLWIEDDAPKFAESWFISRCLKLLPSKIIISYADTGIYDEHNDRYHDGMIYRALNFNYAGQSKASTDWRLPGKTRNVGKNVEGSVAVAVPPKNRYWILTGNKREKGQLKKICNWPSLQFK